MKMLNNQSGQSQLTYLFTLVAFIFVWIGFLSTWFKQIAATTITANGYTGILAFALGNINLFVLIGLIIAFMVAGAGVRWKKYLFI